MDDLDRAHEQFDIHPDAWRYDPGYPPSLEHRRRWLLFRIQELQVHGFGCLAVQLKSSGELIGACGLEFYLRKGCRHSSPEIELYYRLGRDYWGNGYATEAAREIIRYAFDELRLRRVLAHASIENNGSIALLQRLGFDLTPDPTDPGEMAGVLESTPDGHLRATR
jgi:RimJ/RimL family protein N-acetyltransferase